MKSPSESSSFGENLSGTAAPKVLAVDLDGTLLRSDLLWESLRSYLVPAPWRLIQVATWLAKGGRPMLKARLAANVGFDGALLPWSPAVVQFCQSEAANGRQVVLATASNESAAKAATRHFPFISRVIGSDERTNLKATRKAERLIAEFGPGGFDYIGNCRDDLPVWKPAAQALFAGESWRHATLAHAVGKPLIALSDHREAMAVSLMRAVRPHHWLKNILVFVPLLAAHRWADFGCWLKVVPAFLALCCMASASYLLNDLADLDADRRHARKKNRPLANGTLSIPAAGAILALLLFLGVTLALVSGPAALVAVLVYFLLSALYSLTLKTIPVLDAIFLSGLYTYRMVVGGVAGGVAISPWLLAFSTTFFLGLAFLKRYVELDAMSPQEGGLVPRRGYTRSDLTFVLVTGVASSFLSVVVLALYLDSSASNALYSTPHWLWAIALVLLFWLLRVWFLAGRKRLPDDPVWFAAKDPVTFGLALVCVAVIAAAGPR